MEFEIKSERGYSILFHTQEHNKNQLLDYYSVTLTTPSMSATVRIDNAPAGVTPIEFFEKISNGGRGEKAWASLEREFELSAASDSTGHTTIIARVYSGFSSPSAAMSIGFQIEASQLKKIQKKASEFFKYSEVKSCI